MEYDSCCAYCRHNIVTEAKLICSPENCFPAESECECDSENYGSTDGCRYFEEDVI